MKSELPSRLSVVRSLWSDFDTSDTPGRRVDGARAAGWHAVLHLSTPKSIAEMERIIAAQRAD